MSLRRHVTPSWRALVQKWLYLNIRTGKIFDRIDTENYELWWIWCRNTKRKTEKVSYVRCVCGGVLQCLHGLYCSRTTSQLVTTPPSHTKSQEIREVCDCTGGKMQKSLVLQECFNLQYAKQFRFCCHLKPVIKILFWPYYHVCMIEKLLCNSGEEELY